MFIRRKVNKSGVVSVQIIDKSSGKYRVAKTVGSSSDPAEVNRLVEEAHLLLPSLTGQANFNFDIDREKELIDLFFNGIKEVSLAGPELVFGKLFDEIGFNKIKDELFRHLVISRLAFPASKLKTKDYLFRFKGIEVEVDKIYRYLDKLYNKQKEAIQQISYTHTLKLFDGRITFVFYDVTTLYFEAEDEDDLRRTGFSKEGKHQHPQILLGLLVSAGGYPLAYDIFEGNKYEGATMLPVIKAFKEKYRLQSLTVIADAGLLSKENIEQLEQNGFEYILGARLKNESREIKQLILSLKLGNGQSTMLERSQTTKLIIHYSSQRAKKDAANRQRGLAKLARSIASGRLTKANINNRGYNKYLRLEGDIKITIDMDKFSADSQWDGLKGYITNTTMSKEAVIENYNHLWQIEKAFRISKTDLRIRPIYHRLRRRIEAHICIAFCAYKIYKELERQLKEKESSLSPERAIEIANTIYKITIQTPISKLTENRLYLPNDEQQQLLNLFKT